MQVNQIQKVTFWGAITNIVLSLIKIIVGYLVNSIALVADGVHSFSDLITDFLVIIGVYVGEKPPDEKHPYGHGKIETIVTIIIGLFLCFLGVGLLWESAKRFVEKPNSFPGIPIIIVAVLSIIIKEILFNVTKKIAKETNCSTLLANAWHHRSDSLSSLAVLIGGVAVYFGISYGDQIAGIVVGSMIFFTGFKIILEPIGELVEKSIDKESIEKIKNIIDSESKICGWSQLRTRKVGREIFIDLNIQVDPGMTIAVGHSIVDKIENKIKSAFNTPANIVIHIEPYCP